MNLIKISTILILSSFNSIFASCSQFKIPENLTDYILPFEEEYVDINGVSLGTKKIVDYAYTYTYYDVNLTNNTLDIVNLSAVTEYHAGYFNKVFDNLNQNITITTSDKNWINNIKINPIKDNKYTKINKNNINNYKNILKYGYLISMFMTVEDAFGSTLLTYVKSGDVYKFLELLVNENDNLNELISGAFDGTGTYKINNDKITFDISTIGDAYNFRNIFEGEITNTTTTDSSQLSSISSAVNELLKWHKEEIKLFHLWNHEIDKRIKKIKLREEELDKKEEKFKKISDEKK